MALGNFLYINVWKEIQMYNYILCFIFNENTSHHNLYDAIASLGDYFQVLDSVWILISESDSVSIKDKLVTYIGNEDMFFISKLSMPADAAWLNLSPDVTDWLKSKM